MARRETGESVVMCVNCECIYDFADYVANGYVCDNCGSQENQVLKATDEEVMEGADGPESAQRG